MPLLSEGGCSNQADGLWSHMPEYSFSADPVAVCTLSVGRGPLREFLTSVAFSKGLCRPLGYRWRDEGSSWGGLGRGYWEGSWESVMASGLDALGSLWGPPSPSTPIEAAPDPPGGSVSCEALGSRVRPGTAPVTAHFPEALSVLENPLCPPRSAPRPHPVLLSEVVDQARGAGESRCPAQVRHGSGAGGRRSVCRGPGAVVSQAYRSSCTAPTHHHLPNCGFRVARSFSFPGEARSHLCAKQS